MGDVGPGSGTRAYPKALAALLGMKFKLVSGYQSSADILLAMQRERGPGHLRKFRQHSKPPARLDRDQADRQYLFQGAPQSNPELQGVPLTRDLARNDRGTPGDRLPLCRAGHRPAVCGAPGLPPDVLTMLRDAFDASMKDPEFIADVKKQKLDLDPETARAWPA